MPTHCEILARTLEVCETARERTLRRQLIGMTVAAAALAVAVAALIIRGLP